MDEYYRKFPACGGHGRSAHWFSFKVNEKVNEARETIRKFINAKSTNEIVFTRNTTEGINLVARSFNFKEGDEVLTTDREHNSNLCPWRFLEKKGVIKHRVVLSNEDNTFNLENFKGMINGDVKMVSMVHTSNLDGYTIPAEEIVRISHEHGAKVMLDGAQSAPHKPIDVQKLDVDFFAFSVHKMCGPTGMGILYGKEELLKNLEPFLVGGDTVEDTFYDKDPLYLEPPEKFEAGLQNYAGIIGAGAAVKYLLEIGLENISKHENELNEFLTENLSKYKEFDIIGPKAPGLRGGILTLCVNKKGIVEVSEEARGIAGICNTWENIMLRSGEFCVHSWFNARNISREMEKVRASLYLYNTLEECEILIKTLEKVLQLEEFTMLPSMKMEYSHG